MDNGGEQSKKHARPQPEHHVRAVLVMRVPTIRTDVETL